MFSNVGRERLTIQLFLGIFVPAFEEVPMHNPQPDDDTVVGSVNSPDLREFLDRMVEEELLRPIQRRLLPSVLQAFEGLRDQPFVMSELMTAYGALCNLVANFANRQGALELARTRLPQADLEVAERFGSRVQVLMGETGQEWMLVVVVMIAASRLDPELVEAYTDTRRTAVFAPTEH